ncbi:YwpF-like family protein [Bacillus sp. ISL-47]|uniref:YwpF-like family protein n=1 Tax=Bacillus sp. ISL-47 TaxID=2819130 RepID=UPI001BEAD145|nr:YwpF-like family protein [Bacillus sp. ISL-47]MBT2690560.1 YwpF-like family protein [Bacillus sp. ISL-47]MBT2710917.1 YwpF-like family protein [Pseudomonas sp. ISL-84]
MKTFKLVSLQLVEEDGLVDIELDDGLIINKEDEKSNWLLEAYIDKSYIDYFKKRADNKDELIIQVVITKRENDPAAFQTKITSIKELENHISILFEGSLKRTKNDYAELLLQDLLGKGFKGDNLLDEFKDKMQSKPRLAAAKKQNKETPVQ